MAWKWRKCAERSRLIHGKPMDGESHAPYRAPDSAIEETLVRPRRPYFLAPTSGKFSLMMLSTFGFYGIWWFYRNWCAVRRHDQRRISPVWRSVLSILWVYSCFKAIHRIANTDAVRPLPAGALATIFILLSLCTYGPLPIWLLAALTFLPMLPVNAMARRFNECRDPEIYRTEDPINAWNSLGIAVGALLWLVVLLGLLVLAGGMLMGRLTGTV